MESKSERYLGYFMITLSVVCIMIMIYVMVYQVGVYNAKPDEKEEQGTEFLFDDLTDEEKLTIRNEEDKSFSADVDNYFDESQIDLVNISQVIFNGEGFEETDFIDLNALKEEVKNISKDKFFDILNNFIYKEEESNPFEFINSRTGNCYSITMFIAEWLVVNANPNDHKYYLNIETVSTGKSDHIYLMYKIPGKEIEELDFILNKKVSMSALRDLLEFVYKKGE